MWRDGLIYTRGYEIVANPCETVKTYPRQNLSQDMFGLVAQARITAV